MFTQALTAGRSTGTMPGLDACRLAGQRALKAIEKALRSTKQFVRQSASTSMRSDSWTVSVAKIERLITGFGTSRTSAQHLGYCPNSKSGNSLVGVA
jgi:hypothetical protein